MRRNGFHFHSCTNRLAGCKGTYRCSDEYLERNHDPDGVYCGVDPLDSGLCEDCATSICSDCGATLNIQPHEDECPKATAWAV